MLLAAEGELDVVIVGAGLAGSATALNLAQRRPDLRVGLLDARSPGSGSSGLGTGLLGPRFGPPIDVARRRFGDNAARALFERSEQAVRDVVDLAARHAPAALSPCGGQLVVGFTPAEHATVRRRARAYADLDLDVPLVPVHDDARPATAGATALHYRTAAGVDSAALTRGLACAATALGVRTFEGTTVLGLADHPARRTRLTTTRGDLLARAVIVTVDAAAPGLSLPIGGLLDLEVCASATALLPAQLLDDLGGPTAAHVLAANPLGAYRRITPDGRLVLGGGPATAWRGLSDAAMDRRRDAAWAWQRAWLDRIHPALREVPVEHRWSGRITVTADGLPVLGRVPIPGEVWYAGGWNGHGLAATVAAGARLADTVLSHPAGRGRARVPAGSRAAVQPGVRATSHADPALLWRPGRPRALFELLTDHRGHAIGVRA